MKIITLSIPWMIVVDSIAWSIIQTGIAYLCLKFPPAILDHNTWLYRTRAWEKGGAIYEKLFRVKKWKSRLPDAGTIFRGAFSKNRIQSRDCDYMKTWARETCRAELCHWTAILPSVLFFLWNSFPMGVAMVIYAVIFNAIPIIVQRHNRPRLLAIIKKKACG